MIRPKILESVRIVQVDGLERLWIYRLMVIALNIIIVETMLIMLLNYKDKNFKVIFVKK
jgi:hypothetical protein